MVHGDDFTTLATDSQLDWYAAELKKYFEIKIRGRLGEGCTGPQEIRIINRIVRVDQDGLTYEADPMHTDLLLSSLDLVGCTGAATLAIKPVERDEHAVKLDEMTKPSLNTDPDATIAAICHGEHSHGEHSHGELTECEKHSFTFLDADDISQIKADTTGMKLCARNNPDSSIDKSDDRHFHQKMDVESSSTSTSPNKTNPSSSSQSNHRNIQSPMSQGEKTNSAVNHIKDHWRNSHGTWIKFHGAKRRCLDNPSHESCQFGGPKELDPLYSLCVTCGKCDNGKTLTHVDHWRKGSGTRKKMKRPGTGTTVLFYEKCHDIDACAAAVCSLYKQSRDVDVIKSKRVRFNKNLNTVHEIIPYSGIYGCHPHPILGNQNGWKRSPSRADQLP